MVVIVVVVVVMVVDVVWWVLWLCLWLLFDITVSGIAVIGVVAVGVNLV